MSKPSSLFSCSHCDAQFPKWSGRCLECGGWGTLQQTATTPDDPRAMKVSPLSAGTTIAFSDIVSGDTPRFETGISELDTVLGGGIVPGSLILIGGEPGIGKSTLLLQIAEQLKTLSKNESENTVLYCSGEESAQQIKLRYERLFKITKSGEQGNHILFLGETNTETICGTIAAKKPRLAFVDSIQTIYSRDVLSEAGSVAQVRASTVKLLEVAKEHHIPIIIVGHVTKEGMVAGPKTLEHLVDTVLYLEGDNHHYFRLLKTVKNRFGSTNEVGIFEMTDTGLKEVANPSLAFISEQPTESAGTITTAVIEGSRAFLIQVQALTSTTSFGYPQRRAVGFDTNRLQLLIAVLTKRAGLNLADQDIHVNVVGGFKITEPAIDLAVCASIISAYRNKPLPKGTCVFGEVGLNGEVRTVTQIEKRIKEAEKLGYNHIIIPKIAKPPKTTANLIPITSVQELLRDF